MIKIYLLISAILLFFLDNFFPILRESYSWWLVIVLLFGFFIALLFIHLLVFLFISLFIDTKKPQEQYSRRYKAFLSETVKTLFDLLFVKIKTTGKEKIPQNERFLLVCNHLNNIDPAVMIAELGSTDLSFIAKKEVFENMPFVRKVMHKLLCLPIDRENNREAAKTIINAVNIIKEDRSNVVIFPEGYTSKDGKLQPIRNGALKIAIRAKAPIVVCTLKGTYKIEKRLFFKKNIIEFDILDVIDKDEVESRSSAELGEKIYSLMAEKLTNT